MTVVTLVEGLIARTEIQPEQSSTFFERAKQLNPNDAQAIAFLGFNQTLVGRPEHRSSSSNAPSN